MNQRPEADDQLRHELDTMINISAVQDLNYVRRFALKVRIRATPVRPLACASLGESVVQTGLGYPVTLAAAVAYHHHDGSRSPYRRA